MSNQVTGEYKVNPAREWQFFDRLPRELREVYAAAPFKYAVGPRFKELMSLPARQMRPLLIEAICDDIMKSAAKTYGPDHPDAQRNRLDSRRRAA
ncbi:MAG: hypothetical protein ACRDBL_09500 [Rhabdaerophilum sp.]